MNPLDLLQDPIRMHYQYIFNLMQRYERNLKFFDIRDTDSFNSNHLWISLHIPAETFDENSINLSQISQERDIQRLRRYCIIIGYTEVYERQALEFQKLLKSIKCKEIHLLSTIEQFMSLYYFLSIQFKNIRIHGFPNEIIPKSLYLGSQEHAHNREILEVLGITHILNATKTAASLFPGIQYCRVHVDDNESEKISLFFRRAYDFIEAALSENLQGANNIILVHCAKGKSRSATIVLMYLMRAGELTLEESLKFLKQQRDIIEPNEGFIRELQAFEKNRHRFIRSQSSMKFSAKVNEEIKKLSTNN